MIRYGTVDSVSGRLATVLLEQRAQCGRCSRGKGCGLQLLPDTSGSISIACENSVNADVGDSVAVDIGNPPASWLRIVFYAYGLPVIGLILAASVVHGLWQVESLTLVAALLGLAGGLIAWFGLQDSVMQDVPACTATLARIEPLDSSSNAPSNSPGESA